MQSKRSQVMLVDDHPIVREGIRSLLESTQRFNLSIEAGSVHEATDRLKHSASLGSLPDVLICDLALNEQSGFDFIPIAQQLAPSMPILVLSMHDEGLYAERAIRLGASGYLMKSELGGQLLTALDSVLRGEILLSESMKRKAVAKLREGVGMGKMTGSVANSVRRSRQMDALTPRELEIFSWIGQGLTNKQIAAKLNTSPRTIDTHRLSIREKLGYQSNAELMRQAVLAHHPGISSLQAVLSNEV